MSKDRFVRRVSTLAALTAAAAATVFFVATVTEAGFEERPVRSGSAARHDAVREPLAVPRTAAASRPAA